MSFGMRKTVQGELGLSETEEEISKREMVKKGLVDAHDEISFEIQKIEKANHEKRSQAISKRTQDKKFLKHTRESLEAVKKQYNVKEKK